MLEIAYYVTSVCDYFSHGKTKFQESKIRISAVE